MRTLAEAISSRSDVSVLSISHDILLSRYVGEGEGKLREIFSSASRHDAADGGPCVLAFVVRSL